MRLNMTLFCLQLIVLSQVFTAHAITLLQQPARRRSAHSWKQYSKSIRSPTAGDKSNVGVLQDSPNQNLILKQENPKKTKNSFGLDATSKRKLRQFDTIAKKEHGVAWKQMAFSKFMKAGCSTDMLLGQIETMPSWAVFAFKSHDAGLSKGSDDSVQDWMRYGNFCSKQVRPKKSGSIIKGNSACNTDNSMDTTYTAYMDTVSYDVCDDCGLDSSCALQNSAKLGEQVGDVLIGDGPAMCYFSAASAYRLKETSGCSKNFRDGFNVPENGYRKLAACAMIFLPCINYEGPHMAIMEQANPQLLLKCKKTSKVLIQFLACLAAPYMVYRVPLANYATIKPKCLPFDIKCFTQEDERSEHIGNEWNASQLNGTSQLQTTSQSIDHEKPDECGLGVSWCAPIAPCNPTVCRLIAEVLISHVDKDDGASTIDVARLVDSIAAMSDPETAAALEAAIEDDPLLTSSILSLLTSFASDIGDLYYYKTIANVSHDLKKNTARHSVRRRRSPDTPTPTTPAPTTTPTTPAPTTTPSVTNVTDNVTNVSYNVSHE